MYKSLYNELIEYGKKGRYGFHMPGHKRQEKLLDGMDPFEVDITEIKDFDNLHYADGIIKAAMENAADFWETDATWFLVNGSSGGILAAMQAVTDIGDHIIVGRNCHKSVYNGIELRNLDATYLYPEFNSEIGINGGYNPEELVSLFERTKGVKAVIITSPTYDGMISDIKTLSDITHKNNAILIVDEAHGAHLGISEKLPVPAYQLGADIVIESLHKTLPSLTQTAMLHLCGNKVDKNRIEESLGIYQSSSPSYLFMASIDRCICQLQNSGKERLEKLLTTVDNFRKIVNSSTYFYVPGEEVKGKQHIFDYDPTKLIIYIKTDAWDGRKLADILRDRYHFEMEMECEQYILAITSICDKKEEIERLSKSLIEIDKELVFQREKDGIEIDRKTKNETNCIGYVKYQTEFRNKKECSVYEAGKAEQKRILLKNSEGKVSGEYLYLYPPGVPLLVPGEVISKQLLEQIGRFKEKKLNINGLRDKESEYIYVLE